MSTAGATGEPGATSMSAAGGAPTVLRIALGGQLRRLRQDRGITPEAAADSIRASHAKISRLERGRVGFKERDVADLLTLYGVTDPEEREAFLVLARQANSPGWWHQYSDLLPTWFETYIGLEQSASVIRTYEAQFIPGLLQTAEYARAVIRLAHGDEPPEEIDRRVELRMRRQQILDQPDPPAVWVVIDEASLRRPIGGPAVMRSQIEHLITATKRPHVTIQLLPYAIGGHAAAGGPFTIVRFPEADLPDVVYLEQLTSSLYLDKRPDLDRYKAVMEQLSVQAEPPNRTTRLLRKILTEI
jgi:transcriptional regulator with XRE-family HTH domain